MRRRTLKVIGFVLGIVVWAALVLAAGLSLWERHGCMIDAGLECTQEIASK